MSILITTSHKPSPRTRTFIKELAATLPYAVKTNRGKKTLDDLGLKAYRVGAKYIAVVGERRGNPSIMRIYKLDLSEKWPKTKEIVVFKIKGIKLLRENPLGARVYNPESIGVDYDLCKSDECYNLANTLLAVFNDIIDKDPDVKIYLSERSSIIQFKPVDRLGRICGPLIKFRGVKVIEK
ncbi:MAG: hypothetical protein DRO13_00935 [Thermoprotei archaeon]|nr:MAG: hypothetical protein DRO13_00935 [Thermoprotei archaeon]